jgi:hypothetical protein
VSAQDKKEGKAESQTTEISFLFSYLSMTGVKVAAQSPVLEPILVRQKGTIRRKTIISNKQKG